VSQHIHWDKKGIPAPFFKWRKGNGTAAVFGDERCRSHYPDLVIYRRGRREHREKRQKI